MIVWWYYDEICVCRNFCWLRSISEVIKKVKTCFMSFLLCRFFFNPKRHREMGISSKYIQVYNFRQNCSWYWKPSIPAISATEILCFIPTLIFQCDFVYQTISKDFFCCFLGFPPRMKLFLLDFLGRSLRPHSDLHQVKGLKPRQLVFTSCRLWSCVYDSIDS